MNERTAFRLASRRFAFRYVHIRALFTIKVPRTVCMQCLYCECDSRTLITEALETVTRFALESDNWDQSPLLCRHAGIMAKFRSERKPHTCPSSCNLGNASPSEITHCQQLASGKKSARPVVPDSYRCINSHVHVEFILMIA